ncbi:MAG: DUF3576 domain-containing protein [Pseudomonadota bacterium]|nr:DUF3576 domain-containing protein [Pseudomonadota bacterium]
MQSSKVLLALILSTFGLVSACGNPSFIKPEDDPDLLPPTVDGSPAVEGSILGGSGGLSMDDLFGTSKKRRGEGGGGIGVNVYLWRATLNTLAFLPLKSADPFGGVVITDWYTPPGTPKERVKLNVYILDRTLSSDGVRVSVFRQIKTAGNWVEAPVKKETGVKLEDQILFRARQLRVAAQRFAK